MFCNQCGNKVCDHENNTQTKYYNSKTLSFVLLCVSIAGLCCFFFAPIYSGKIELFEEVIELKVKLQLFLSAKGTFYYIVSCLILSGYGIIIINSFLNLWHDKWVEFKILYAVCNFITFAISIIMIICGAYLIANFYSDVLIPTIVILFSQTLIQGAIFFRCKLTKVSEINFFEKFLSLSKINNKTVIQSNNIAKKEIVEECDDDDFELEDNDELNDKKSSNRNGTIIIILITLLAISLFWILGFILR